MTHRQQEAKEGAEAQGGARAAPELQAQEQRNEQRVHPSHQENIPTLHAHTHQAPATQMNSILSSARAAQITEVTTVTT